MKKVLILLVALLLVTGCKKEENISYVRCTLNDESLGNLVEIDLEFKNDKLFFMKQTQTFEYDTETLAMQAASNLDANSYLINDQFEHIKAYTEVEGTNVLAITEHEVSKFTSAEKESILLTDDTEKGLTSNFENKGYKCNNIEKDAK